jgi:hypothetical protein
MDDNLPAWNVFDDLNENESIANFETELLSEHDLHCECTVDGIALELTGDEKLLFDFSGTLRRIYLSVDTAFQGVTYKAKTWLEFYASGKPMQGYLAYDQVYRGAKYKGERRIVYYETGSVAKGYLAENYSVKIGDNVFEFLKDRPIRHYRSGNVFSGYQSEILRLVGPYSFIVDIGTMRFYEFGLIQQCISYDSHHFSYAGNTYTTRKRSRIGFSDVDYRGQSIVLANFDKGFRLGIYEFYAGHSVSFYSGNSLDNPGALRRFVSPVLLLDQNVYVKPLKNIWVHDNGVFKDFQAGKDFRKNGVRIYEGSGVRLHKNTYLEHLLSSKELTIDGKKYRPWSRFWFDEFGRLKCIHENGTPSRICV